MLKDRAWQRLRDIAGGKYFGLCGACASVDTSPHPLQPRVIQTRGWVPIKLYLKQVAGQMWPEGSLLFPGLQPDPRAGTPRRPSGATDTGGISKARVPAGTVGTCCFSPTAGAASRALSRVRGSSPSSGESRCPRPLRRSEEEHPRCRTLSSLPLWPASDRNVVAVGPHPPPGTLCARRPTL